MTAKILRSSIIALLICGLCWYFFIDQYHRHVWNTDPIPQSEHFKLHPSVPLLSWSLVGEIGHEREFFTQGLHYENGYIYEGTGNYGQSGIYKKTDFGQITQAQRLDPSFFGEGITLKGDSLIQLSWKEGTAFVWQKDSLQLLDTYTYEEEGWGIAWNGTHFITTNGGASLTFREPTTFKAVQSIEVYDATGPISKLNELELVNDTLWANVWGSDYAVGIDPSNGEVIAALNLKRLKYEMRGRALANVLNGIAYKKESDTFLITGKNWTRIFEIKIDQ